MYNENVFIENNNVQWEEVGQGVRRKILAYDDKLMVVRVEFKKGSIGNIHQHYHSQITNVESGSFEVQIDSRKQLLKAGDAFYIPPNIDHGCVCMEDGVLIDVFSPMREDFILSGNNTNGGLLKEKKQ
ncbi:cupin domain-containing protein [Sediminibacterium sp.]|jgi:quercetin dioxygenase-like cupin family protein|uniref:cupin domain-containing protein n=1 Tax=Sediminibacterium sp. TaxID=1917865 RepID=UPI0025E2F7E9|nr:cupin domain-containing protein [Sediminibacterium sp.]MBW0178493.1 cupin domain-containing protein [Sediminibacterium sp.]